jgi:hypothetical protein
VAPIARVDREGSREVSVYSTPKLTAQLSLLHSTHTPQHRRPKHARVSVITPTPEDRTKSNPHRRISASSAQMMSRNSSPLRMEEGTFLARLSMTTETAGEPEEESRNTPPEYLLGTRSYLLLHRLLHPTPHCPFQTAVMELTWPSPAGSEIPPTEENHSLLGFQ